MFPSIIAHDERCHLLVSTYEPGESIVAGGLVSFSPPQASASRCTPFQSIRVPIGTRLLQTRATTVAGAQDTDLLLLRCLRPPRVP